MKIMVIPSILVSHLKRDTLVTDPSDILGVMQIINDNKEYRERSLMEENPSYRQPIPYALIQNTFTKRYVMMGRNSAQGEKRLHGKKYLGSGGHIEDGHDTMQTAAKELHEELMLPLLSLSLQGVMITTGGSVEDVHLCLFYVGHTFSEAFNSEEKLIQEPEWVTKEQVKEHFPNMEKWSQIIARDYIGV
jgi:predicted NUDIX family phosphoesterase